MAQGPQGNRYSVTTSLPRMSTTGTGSPRQTGWPLQWMATTTCAGVIRPRAKGAQVAGRLCTLANGGFGKELVGEQATHLEGAAIDEMLKYFIGRGGSPRGSKAGELPWEDKPLHVEKEAPKGEQKPRSEQQTPQKEKKKERIARLTNELEALKQSVKEEEEEEEDKRDERKNAKSKRRHHEE